MVIMVKIVKRNFDNPFPDFSVESAKGVILNREVDGNSKVATSFKKKWEQTLTRLNHLDTNDYSVYTGTSGIALLKLLKDSEDKNNLLEVKRLLGLNNVRHGHQEYTFLCGIAGPLAIGAVVCNRLSQVDECQKLVEELLSMQNHILNYQFSIDNEFLYGRSGYLYALLYVNKYIKPPPVDDSIITNVIDVILAFGKEGAKSGKFPVPLMYKWNDTYYLGGAHGISGILYLLLQVPKYLTDSTLTTLIKPTVDYLTSLRFPSGNFPSSIGSDTDRYVQWCHGAPGFSFLYTAAYKVFGDKKYLNLALQCGDTIWERGVLVKGYSICHGVSGNAYSFLDLYQTTKDVKHLYRAVKFAEWCVDYRKDREEVPPDRPLSLFEGIAGPMYLLVDLQKPMEAKFPGFTL